MKRNRIALTLRLNGEELDVIEAASALIGAPSIKEGARFMLLNFVTGVMQSEKKRREEAAKKLKETAKSEKSTKVEKSEEVIDDVSKK